MPAISKIRFTNVIYENGEKRYNDDIFQFEGHNGAILLENGGGKTVFVQTAIQAILPHSDLAERKIKNTLMLENSTAHIAIEWILSERPRRYALTSVSLFMNRGAVDSLKYVYEYEEGNDNSIEKLPFVKESVNGKKRPATKEEASEYYSEMSQNKISAKTFSTIKDYHEYIEKSFKIIPSEWRKIALINGAEGDVEAFFDACKTTGQLVDNLLIPTVEEALAGDGTKEFAETFEKQREHFKKYKQLKARIDESRLVEEQINSYVKVYKSYDEVNQSFTKIKKHIKALYKFAQKEDEINREKLMKNKEVQSLLEEEEKHWKQKEASYKLQLLKDRMLKREKSFVEISDKYNEVINTKEEKEKRLENLKAAKYKQNIKIHQQKIQFLREQINDLDKDEDIEDINEKLELNSSELKGYYEDQEEKLYKEISIIEGQLRNIEKEIAEIEKEAKKSKDKENELSKAEAKLDGSINQLTKDMDNLEREILDNQSKEKIEEEFDKWQRRISDLENTVFEYNKQMRMMRDEKQELLQSIPEQRKELNNLKREETELSEQLKNLNELHDSLLLRVKEFRSSWFSFDSMYRKQSTILEQLENKQERLREEKENLIFEERLAHRWLDNYSESEFYTADPSIERYIKNWRNGFKYIESGTEYLQRAAKSVDRSEEELNESYPYWTISIVTSEAEIEKLIDKINNQRSELSHPVIVMNEKEARDKAQGNSALSEGNILFPLMWNKNIVKRNFESWKNEISIKADEVTKLRRNKEEELSGCFELLKDVRDFYGKYPHEDYIEMQKKQISLKDKTNLFIEDIYKKEARIKNIDKEIGRVNTATSEAQGEQHILEQKILKARDYSRKKKEKEKAEGEKIRIKKELILAKEESFKVERRAKLSQDSKEEIKEKLNEINTGVSVLRADPLYKEVIDASPSYSSISKEVLMQQRKSLKDVLEKKQKGRETLEESMKNALEIKSTLEKELNNLIKQIDFELDEALEFPIYGDEEMDRLIEELQKLKKPFKNLKKAYDDANTYFEREKAIYESEENRFHSKYEMIISFSEALEQIELMLKEELEAIVKKKEYFLGQQEAIEKEGKNINSSISKLVNYNFKYSYLSEEIEEAILSDDIKNQFPYKRAEIVDETIKNIERTEKLLEDRKLGTEDKKRKFINFCESEIVDVKLKDMAVTGVQYKKSYKDVTEWQNKMNERIMRTIEIAENDIREHDKEVQQFINHLHSYLASMIQELKQIPKKTRIKIDEDWKEIFVFNVPEYNEKEGKEELAKHIDWMLKQLEGDQFKDENGVELENQVRKSIEKWLQSKQLLQIVMKQNNIKVKCRKVTNDQKINSMPYSWEVSNSWSGGEKWSKNMSLFLGILNYLAEKRTQITSNHKRYRTVIVDNPFGKASSDHVLNPVFFIAEQLGFQIIALTAHAEGKFVRTYFPIVYSCRLRNADNSSSQIMTKEREIKKAFLKDSDPQALSRLGQLEQIAFTDIYRQEN
ncbi:hypothetical protein I6U48_19565 [Clostridium sp. PL3]|uniref:Chromosome segregation ATPase n=1 Tax=Clostridium thailandense TaxID=2794346 RepID=A0A949X558_9CLOT|nr:hypothetical protein [Clostridium thailandense]MBV7275103.1 hypothetical protein [Clostridium thailandense]